MVRGILRFELDRFAVARDGIVRPALVEAYEAEARVGPAGGRRANADFREELLGRLVESSGVKVDLAEEFVRPRGACIALERTLAAKEPASSTLPWVSRISPRVQ